MLLNFAVTNFKNIATSLEDAPLELAPCNVLVGPNGVGKTSLLQAVDFLKAFYGPNIESYLKERNWGFEDLPNLKQTRKKISWSAEFAVPADASGEHGGIYKLKISIVKRRYLSVGEEILRYKQNKEDQFITLIKRTGRSTLLRSFGSDQPKAYEFWGLPCSVAVSIARTHASFRSQYGHILRFMEYVRSIRYASIFDVEKLRAPARGYAEEIGPKGEDLIPFLAKLQAKNDGTFDKIRKETVRLFGGNITDFNIKGHASASAVKMLEVYEGNTVFNGRQVSDGFLRMLAIISLKYSETAPTILLFEEPENGVHPRLLARMVEAFRSMPKRKGRMTQVLLTTHSPYVLDLFRDHPEQVIAVRRVGAQAGAEFIRVDAIFPNGLPDAPLGETWYENRLLGA